MSTNCIRASVEIVYGDMPRAKRFHNATNDLLIICQHRKTDRGGLSIAGWDDSRFPESAKLHGCTEWTAALTYACPPSNEVMLIMSDGTPQERHNSDQTTERGFKQ